jgi:hypothetical protein
VVGQGSGSCGQAGFQATALTTSSSLIRTGNLQVGEMRRPEEKGQMDIRGAASLAQGISSLLVLTSLCRKCPC